MRPTLIEDPDVTTNPYRRKIWDNTATQETEFGECWLWAGPINGKPDAPLLTMQGKTTTVRQHVWALWVKEPRRPPQGRRIMTVCDTPGCINPEHFFIRDEVSNEKLMSRKELRKQRFSDYFNHHLVNPNDLETLGKIYVMLCNDGILDHTRIHPNIKQHLPPVD